MPQAPRRKKPTSPPPETSSDPAGSSSSPGSSGPTSSLGFAGTAFRKPDEAPPAATARSLEADDPPAPPPPPILWDDEKLRPILTGIGYALHSLDPVASSPNAPELWKLTEDDAAAMAAPLARIANRYDTVRQVAGYSDELSIAVAAGPYIKRNLAERGRAKALDRQAEQQTPHGSRYEPDTPEPAQWQEQAPPDLRDVSSPPGEDDNPNIAEGDVFGGPPGDASLTRLPPFEPGPAAA